MPGLNSARSLCLAVTMTALGLNSLVGAGTGVAAQAATGATRPVTGKLQSLNKHGLVVMQLGTKKLTPILLNAKTLYIVKGKLVAKAPVLSPGSLVSVVIAGTKAPITAQLVVVGPAPTAPSQTAPAPPTSSTTAPAPASTSIKGTVTLTSPVSVTLRTSAGTQTIKLTSATRYVVAGKPSSFKPSLHAGEKVEITAVQTHGVLVGKLFTVV